jgi:hypothetical protein
MQGGGEIEAKWGKAAKQAADNSAILARPIIVRPHAQVSAVILSPLRGVAHVALPAFGQRGGHVI